MHKLLSVLVLVLVLVGVIALACSKKDENEDGPDNRDSAVVSDSRNGEAGDVVSEGESGSGGASGTNGSKDGGVADATGDSGAVGDSAGTEDSGDTGAAGGSGSAGGGGGGTSDSGGTGLNGGSGGIDGTGGSSGSGGASGTGGDAGSAQQEPDPMEGCRGPEEENCDECCKATKDGESCVRLSTSTGSDWYNSSELIDGPCPIDCEPCAQCLLRDEQDLETLGNRPECDCDTIEIGIDPCFVAMSCACYCSRYLRLAEACPNLV